MRVSVTARSAERHYLCPIDVPVTVLGGKWKLLIVYFLLQAPQRNSDLRRLIPPLSQKVLTHQLRELESDGIVERTVVSEMPPHVSYAVAASQREQLEPLVQALFDWGVRWVKAAGGTFQDGDCGTNGAR